LIENRENFYLKQGEIGRLFSKEEENMEISKIYKKI